MRVGPGMSWSGSGRQKKGWEPPFKLLSLSLFPPFFPSGICWQKTIRRCWRLYRPDRLSLEKKVGGKYIKKMEFSYSKGIFFISSKNSSLWESQNLSHSLSFSSHMIEISCSWTCFFRRYSHIFSNLIGTLAQKNWRRRRRHVSPGPQTVKVIGKEEEEEEKKNLPRSKKRVSSHAHKHRKREREVSFILDGIETICYFFPQRNLLSFKLTVLCTSTLDNFFSHLGTKKFFFKLISIRKLTTKTPPTGEWFLWITDWMDGGEGGGGGGRSFCSIFFH